LNENSLLKQFGKTVPFVVKTELKAISLNLDGIKLLMPFEPNINHVGVMYAGALCTLAEVMGGAVFRVYLNKEGTFVITRGLDIKFTRPARTDVTSEYIMDPSEAEQILNECEKNGKADFNLKMELKDKDGIVVAVSEGFYQIRKGTKF
jgi:acyl-coenzyme A thioesterase PaaI-like protein